MTDNSSYFHSFDSSIEAIELPTRFTFPFYYKPHTLVELAAEQLQNFLTEHKVLGDQFNLNDSTSDSGLGKMFGVLVVEDIDGRIGFLAAFSGRLCDRYIMDGFVPPLYDNAQNQNSILPEN